MVCRFGLLVGTWRLAGDCRDDDHEKSNSDFCVRIRSSELFNPDRQLEDKPCSQRGLWILCVCVCVCAWVLLPFLISGVL